MKLKKIIRDTIVVVRSNWFKLVNRNSIFDKTSILFKRIKISNSSVGKYTYFAGGGSVNNASIGAFCSIADGVKIGLGLHPLNWISTHPTTYSSQTIFPYRIFDFEEINVESKPIVIGNDVWVGANVIIMDGVAIGDGAVIAAGAIVTKDVERYSVVAGVPARIISKRKEFKLANGKCWWDLGESELSEFLTESKNNVI